MSIVMIKCIFEPTHVCRFFFFLTFGKHFNPSPSWGTFLESPEEFSHPESHMIAYDYSACILNMNKGYIDFIQEVSGLYTALFFDTDQLKMA